MRDHSHLPEVRSHSLLERLGGVVWEVLLGPREEVDPSAAGREQAGEAWAEGRVGPGAERWSWGDGVLGGAGGGAMGAGRGQGRSNGELGGAGEERLGCWAGPGRGRGGAMGCWGLGRSDGRWVGWGRAE